MNEAITCLRHRLGRTVAADGGLSWAIALQAAHAGGEAYPCGFKGRTAEATFFSQQGCTATETFVHTAGGRVRVGAGRPDTQSTLFVGVLRFDGRTQQVLGCNPVVNPLVPRALADELGDSRAVEGDRLQALLAAVASFGDNRLWDELASPLPRPSAASYPQLAVLAS